MSPGTVSNLNARIYTTIEDWRRRPIEGEHPYVYLDGIALKRSWGGEVRNVSVLVAFGVNREISWVWPKERGKIKKAGPPSCAI